MLLRQRIVVYVCGALLLAATVVPAVPDADTWFHLRIGEELLTSGSFLRTEVFSFTQFGTPWENHEWLFQAVAAFVWRVGGWPSLAWFSALCGVAALLLSWRGSRFSWHTLLLGVLALGALTPFITARPQLFAYMGLAGMLYVLEKLFEWQTWRWGALLGGILLFWANTHASVILALAVGVVYALDVVWGNLSRVSPATKKLFGISLGAGLLSTLVNPLGLSIYTYALQPLRQADVFSVLLETMPLTAHLGTDQGLLIALMHVIIGALALWYATRPDARAFRTLGLGILFWVMPFVSMKYVPFAWMALLPMAFHALTRLRVSDRIGWACAALSLAGVLFFGWHAGAGFRDPYAVWPRELFSFVDEHIPVDVRMYHPMTWGNYIIAHTPERKVFLWGGCACFYGDTFYDAEAFAKGERVDELLQKYQFDVALVRPWESAAYALSTRPDWALIYWDDFGMVFVRRNTAYASLIQEFELPITYINDTVEATLRKVSESALPALLGGYAKAIERSPYAVLPRMRLGMFFQALGRCDLARDTWLPLSGEGIARGIAYRKLAECYDTLGDIAARDYAREMAQKHAEKMISG